MAARLASSVLVGALLRKAEADGGFGAVLAKGDSTAGAITLILAERGRNLRILERALRPDGSYQWQEIPTQAVANSQNLNQFLERRRKFDPDMWLIELDVPSAERFAAEMTGIG